jgi:hypothetical protein
MRRLTPLLLLWLAAAPARAQVGRAALAAGNERYLQADYQHAVPLLAAGLDPTGPRDSLWLEGVTRLADVLLVLRQDSLAATWLRWASRLVPDFRVDEDEMPPAVVRAAQAARAFVDSTPSDRFVTTTRFVWSAVFSRGTQGSVRLGTPGIPITARIGTDQFLRGGESRDLTPGSYPVVVSAPGYLTTRLTVEVLPGVVTVVDASPLPETAAWLYVAARPWGALLVDSELIGYTGVAAHRIAPGPHVLQLRRSAGAHIDTSITIAERQEVRLSWVARRDTTGTPGLDSALAVLDAGETEKGSQMLRPWLAAEPGSLAPRARALGLARLAEADWSLGAKDSARVSLREMVQADPFYAPPSDLFNPELRAAYVAVRHATPAIAVRAPADTVLNPLNGAFPVDIAVGQAGGVRVFLRLTSPRPRDSLLVALSVDSVAKASIPLTVPDGHVLAPGDYAIEAEVVLPAGSVRDLLQLSVERQAVDTAAHPVPLPATGYLPETRKTAPSFHTFLEGVGLGAIALMVPVAVNDRDVTGRTIPLAAGLVGGAVALANMLLKRPSAGIPENIEHNKSVRAQWDQQDRSIAMENAERLRRAPLRIRTSHTP